MGVWHGLYLTVDTYRTCFTIQMPTYVNNAYHFRKKFIIYMCKDMLYSWRIVHLVATLSLRV